jgi:methylated-DNA-[protein]-cysteine S-methyltransferase
MVHTFETAIGTCGVEWDDAGLTRVHLPRTRALRHARVADPQSVPARVRAAAAAIVRLLAGADEDLREVALSDASVEPFARRVYAATRAVGPGRTTTYGAIARELDARGGTGSARAVGAALGANPFPIVVPCHRVLAADGSLHGFSAPGGIATKRRMLELERAPGFTQQALFA